MGLLLSAHWGVGFGREGESLETECLFKEEKTMFGA